MQLRSTTRLPGRYREDDIPPLPGTASFVHPTVPYNPNLPPAAFPTLEYPRPVDTRPAEIMAVPIRPESPDSDLEQEAPPKRATVFRSKRQLSNECLQRVLPSSAEPEQNLALGSQTSRLQEWDLSEKYETEPGEYDDWGVMLHDEWGDESPRVGLAVYEQAEGWARVTDGLKLIIVMELTAFHSFEGAMRMLVLSDNEHNEVVDLFEQEIARQTKEDEKIAQSQARQLEMLLKGPLVTSREAFSALLEGGLYTDLDNSATFIIKKTDIAHAQRFLRSLKLKGYADRLWRYEGVAPPPIIWDVSSPKANELSNAIECTMPEGEQQDLQTRENAEIDFENGKKTKGKALLRKADKMPSRAKPLKRSGPASRLLALKLPSGLRNSVSGDNLEETVAVGPPALQAALSPVRQPAPPPQKQKRGVQHLRFIKKIPAKPSAQQILPEQAYNPFEHTPGSATTRKHTYSWLTNHVEPYTPLPPSCEKTPSRLSTPSRAPIIPLTLPRARLAPIDYILGKEKDAVNKLGTSEREYAVSIAPPIGATPKMLPGKTRSASIHADAETTLLNNHIESNSQDAMEDTQGKSSEAYKQPVSSADAPGESVTIALHQKKRKIQGHDEGAYKVSAWKRQKTQGCGKEEEQQSPKMKKKSKIMDGIALSGAAAVDLKAPKDNFSETSAANLKRAKSLEGVPAEKTNDPNGITKEARMTDDGKQAVGKKRKRGHVPDDDPDL